VGVLGWFGGATTLLVNAPYSVASTKIACIRFFISSSFASLRFTVKNILLVFSTLVSLPLKGIHDALRPLQYGFKVKALEKLY